MDLGSGRHMDWHRRVPQRICEHLPTQPARAASGATATQHAPTYAATTLQAVTDSTFADETTSYDTHLQYEHRAI